MYDVRVDERKRRVLIEFRGFLTAENLKGLDEALIDAALKAKGSGDHFDMLADFSRCEVMGQDTTKDSERRIAWCVDNGLRKCANVVSKALMTVQLKRLVPESHIQLFASHAEAEAWLAKP